MAKNAAAKHPGREDSDPPQYPPPRKPTLGERLNEMKLRVVSAVFVFGTLGTVAKWTLDQFADRMRSEITDAAAKAIQQKFDSHPVDAFGRPLPSLSEKLSKAADLVEWAGQEADAQSRTQHRLDELDAKTAEIEKAIARGKR